MDQSPFPGVTHTKRWQDVMRLLDAGIDVYTTLNVQHLESLNDVIAQITGVVVRETVPDSILEQADEVELSAYLAWFLLLPRELWTSSRFISWRRSPV